MSAVELDPRTRLLLEAPAFPLLLKLASPNALAFLLQATVSMTEVWYIGRLGVNSLAAIALVFPFLMLMQMMSAGAFGGAVTSAIARSLGAGNIGRAESLIWHAGISAVVIALLLLLLHLFFGRAFLMALGGEGQILAEAIAYADVLFLGAVILWLMNTFNAVFRGMGNMQFPAGLMMLGAAIQVPLSGMLILGWWGFPQLGILGAAVSAISVAFLSMILSLLKLTYGDVTVGLKIHAIRFSRQNFSDILKVALPASLAPFLTVLSILVLTGLVGRFGTAALAGYGIGSRLEFLLVPMVFGIGAAMTSMVGVNIGGGNIARAERISWIGGIFAASITGLVGGASAIWPEVWVGLFTSDPATFEVGIQYMRVVGPFYALQGLGLSLYFASQGAGKVNWPIIATIARFIVTAGGATVAVIMLDGSLSDVFLAAAAGMTIYGLGTAVAIKLGAWRR